MYRASSSGSNPAGRVLLNCGAYRWAVHPLASLFFCQSWSLVGNDATPRQAKALSGRPSYPRKLKWCSISRIIALSEKSSARNDRGTISARMPRGFSNSAALRQQYIWDRISLPSSVHQRRLNGGLPTT